MIEPVRKEALLSVLGQARDAGFLGPGPVEDHVEHSLAFVLAWRSIEARPPADLIDLGSGGGVPGLVLAEVWPSCEVVLLDGSERRVAFLAGAISTLGHEGRVGATVQRAEETGRGPMRGRRQLVTARGLAPPAVTAEVGAPLLAPKGVLLVSEPPGGDARRWPPEPLRELGLETAGVITQPAAVQILVRRGSVPDRYPRRVGVPGKRPLWS